MGTLIEISASQNQLRQNRTLLLTIASSSSILGLLIWSATPFLLNSRTDNLQKALRYFSLTGTLCCGVAAIVAGKQLERITPLIKALETAEQSDFYTQLASSQFVQEENWNAVAASRVDAIHQPAIAQNQHAIAPANHSAAHQLPEPQSQAPESFQDYRTLYKAITALKKRGIADKWIIQEILECSGENLEQGKKVLGAILDLGKENEW